MERVLSEDGQNFFLRLQYVCNLFVYDDLANEGEFVHEVFGTLILRLYPAVCQHPVLLALTRLPIHSRDLWHNDLFGGLVFLV